MVDLPVLQPVLAGHQLLAPCIRATLASLTKRAYSGGASTFARIDLTESDANADIARRIV